MKFTVYVSLYVNMWCTEELQDKLDVEDISEKAYKEIIVCGLLKQTNK